MEATKMEDAIEVLSVVLVAVALVPALAHALEWPGKARLTRDAYFAVQPIYYPGFTFAGVGEPLAIVAVIALALLAPGGSTYFGLTCIAVAGLVGMHAIFWLFTQPVNKFWLREQRLGRLGSAFFATGAARDSREGGAETAATAAVSGAAEPGDWTRLRDRWERSHVARSALASVSFVALVVAVATHDSG
jgi:hypothetical protein